MANAHQYSCSACGFQVRSENRDETIDMVREHAKDNHDMEISRGDVRDGIEEVTVS